MDFPQRRELLYTLMPLVHTHIYLLQNPPEFSWGEYKGFGTHNKKTKEKRLLRVFSLRNK